MDENLLSIRVLPTDFATEFICKKGHQIQMITGTKKVYLGARIAFLIGTHGLGALIPGFHDVASLIPAPIHELYDLKETLSGGVGDFALDKVADYAGLGHTKKLIDDAKEVYEILLNVDSKDKSGDILKDLDYSKDTFTAKDKAHLSMILEGVWRHHLSKKSQITCSHKEKIVWHAKPAPSKCSLCKTVLSSRADCSECKSAFCTVCYRWQKIWKKCPLQHELIYHTRPIYFRCDKCLVTSTGPRLEDKQCNINLHLGCGPFKFGFVKETRALNCHCGRQMEDGIKKKETKCMLCFEAKDGHLVCSRCQVKVCPGCIISHVVKI